MYATQLCNIRSTPSTENDNNIIGSLLQADGIHITGKVDGINWYEVSLADGSTGYISSKLLTETKPAVQIETPAPTTQQEAASQSDRLLKENEIINELTGEPLKPGDKLVNGMTYLGEIQYNENGDIVEPDGTIVEFLNK